MIALRTILLGFLVPALTVTGLIGETAPPWRPQYPPLDVSTIDVGDISLQVEIARAPQDQQRGLSYRDGLRPGTGMLFVYDEATSRSFWMKGMRFCLDIVWIADGAIVGAAPDICPAPAGTSEADIPRARSPLPAQYVLEVPAGWLAANGFGAGTPVTIEPGDVGD